ncbi:MAG: phage tail protein [Chloroflexota bacterium]
MSHELISQASPSGAELDSLSAHEFAVEIEGERVTGIFRVSGLTPFKLDIKSTTNRLAREPFKIAKMVQRDPNNAFNRWLQETAKAREDIVRPTRQLSIVAIDDGVETRRWTVNGAYIIEVSYSEFNTASSELVEEVLTIMYDSIEESWPSA